MKKKLPFRPILKLPRTNGEKVLDCVGLGLFAASIFYLLFNWGDIPVQIPAQFNWDGEVKRWGSKVELVILPCIGLFLSIVLSLFEKNPHMHNYSKRLNESNVAQFYLNSRKMFNAIKNSCLAIFSFLIVQIVRVSLGYIETLGGWFLLMMLIILLVPIVFGVYKQSKIG